MDGLKIQNIGGLNCYEKNGVAYLNLEQAARGLGFTHTEKKNGTEYTTVRWERIGGYLAEFGFAHKWAKDGYIPENIFYRLAMKAKNEAAEKFQAWVADEVIPAIRKTGGYIAGADKMTDAEIMAQAVLVANRTIEARDARIRELEAKAKADAPKVLYADAVAAADGGMLLREFAKFLRENGVDMGEKRLFEDMRKRGFLIKAEGRDRNTPTQRAMDMGLFTVKETVIQVPLLGAKTRTTPLLTGKGKVYFMSMYLRERDAAANPAPVADALGRIGSGGV